MTDENNSLCIRCDVVANDAMNELIEEVFSDEIRWFEPFSPSLQPKLYSDLHHWDQGFKQSEGSKATVAKVVLDGWPPMFLHEEGREFVGFRRSKVIKWSKVIKYFCSGVLESERCRKVINFDMPQSAEGYVHHIGRTERAYSTGASLSLVSAEEMEIFEGVKSTFGENENKDSHFIASFPLLRKNAVQSLR
ncbi:hypothetical protein RHMOL_Rhmol08G0282500 [Rhododendron molle]|uniref:Uncharacterized protein n=7 Tax=Rhododendron molle TaxID=49168 RepID=A0ACC0MTD4_RHOML|nr:hypothetical protein RHMOL_Rhmol08G0282500 [Rhododendron molle]KAI8544263.1 hypothetical protein RHMOL_Rhmol08G0282500 [Rhododendron molle]KAI8544264.1 hypothetical protein RHMOL_Rhmol08G0282500 [Rhododendron molle]KAI8544265.1 hypothetical protein RHMOL_Rhmol08G0282500 [Rhododendron molle]KAI8544266.1 hypothetical protein RHMOL_Rhmol08G0282500 [Rhododendron molle]